MGQKEGITNPFLGLFKNVSIAISNKFTHQIRFNQDIIILYRAYNHH